MLGLQELELADLLVEEVRSEVTVEFP